MVTDPLGRHDPASSPTGTSSSTSPRTWTRPRRRSMHRSRRRRLSPARPGAEASFAMRDADVRRLRSSRRACRGHRLLGDLAAETEQDGPRIDDRCPSGSLRNAASRWLSCRPDLALHDFHRSTNSAIDRRRRWHRASQPSRGERDPSESQWTPRKTRSRAVPRTGRRAIGCRAPGATNVERRAGRRPPACGRRGGWPLGNNSP
jgi:hypothetical protein